MKKKTLNLKKLNLYRETILDLQAALETDKIMGGASVSQACNTNPFINYSCRQGCEPEVSQLCNTVACPATAIGGGTC